MSRQQDILLDKGRERFQITGTNVSIDESNLFDHAYIKVEQLDGVRRENIVAGGTYYDVVYWNETYVYALCRPHIDHVGIFFSSELPEELRNQKLDIFTI